MRNQSASDGRRGISIRSRVSNAMDLRVFRATYHGRRRTHEIRINHRVCHHPDDSGPCANATYPTARRREPRSDASSENDPHRDTNGPGPAAQLGRSAPSADRHAHRVRDWVSDRSRNLQIPRRRGLFLCLLHLSRQRTNARGNHHRTLGSCHRGRCRRPDWRVHALAQHQGISIHVGASK